MSEFSRRAASNSPGWRTALTKAPIPGVVAFLISIVVAPWAPRDASAAGGDQEWVSRFGLPGALPDHAASVATSPDGTRIFVTGDSTGSSGSPLVYKTDYATIAYDAATGAELWTSRYDGPGREEDVACCVAVSPDGSRVYVTGYSQTHGEGHSYATLAYDAATGTTLWVSRWPGREPHDMVVNADGTQVLVTGYSITLDIDSLTGEVRWAAAYDPSGSSRDVALSIRVDPLGAKVFVTGAAARDTQDGNCVTYAYDSWSGATLWSATYDGPAHDTDGCTSVAVSPNGARVYVTGYSETRPQLGNLDYVTLAYDAGTGTRVWVRRFASRAHKDDSAWGLAVSPDGSRLYVTGTSRRPSSGNDYFTLAYEAGTGSHIWGQRWNGPGNHSDVPHALVVSPDGTRLFVTGQSRGANSPDCATVSYDASTGASSWVRLYDGPVGGRDECSSVVVGTDGSSVFVTGPSAGVGRGADYATIAYQA